MVISTYTWQAKRSLAWFTAKRWIDERRREVSEYLKANVNTLKEVYRVLEMSPGLGDQPKDGYWNAPAHDRSARVFVEEEAGDDATTTVDKDMKNDGTKNSYSARTTKIFRKQSISNSCTMATLADVLTRIIRGWLPGKGYGYNLPSRRCATGRRRRFAL